MTVNTFRWITQFLVSDLKGISHILQSLTSMLFTSLNAPAITTAGQFVSVPLWKKWSSSFPVLWCRWETASTTCRWWTSPLGRRWRGAPVSWQAACCRSPLMLRGGSFGPVMTEGASSLSSLTWPQVHSTFPFWQSAKYNWITNDCQFLYHALNGVSSWEGWCRSLLFLPAQPPNREADQSQASGGEWRQLHLQHICSVLD